jgi:DNA-binding MarR family transcriptional regulator
MRSRSQPLERIPIAKLADIFCKVSEVVLTDQALGAAPCNNLSRSQWEGILFVQRHEYCSIRNLAEGLGVSHPAAVKMVERLVRKGLLDRRESVQDRRVVELSVSGLGQACVETVRNHRAQGLESFLAQMSVDETESLLVGLQSFLRAALHDPETAEAVCLHCGREHVEECLIHQSAAAQQAS